MPHADVNGARRRQKGCDGARRQDGPNAPSRMSTDREDGPEEAKETSGPLFFSETLELLMPRRIALLVGLASLALSSFVLFRPGLGGVHLSPAHALGHAIVGVLLIWVGIRSSVKVARLSCASASLLFLALGLLGFALGSRQMPSEWIPGPANNHLWRLVPGFLELGTRDHIVHLAMAATALVGALWRPRNEARSASDS